MENGSSISKVTVEYHDPSGVFPLISKRLQSHLPLRDLHWKSPSRPLRSIEFLHIDLLAAKDNDRPASKHGATGPEQNSPARALGERRHQIPGLRQTPYLKVFLLRCDDSENYKSIKRKEVREWLKSQTSTSQTSSSKNAQENHDAFEWLIVHVVLPHTNAASQPRISGSSSNSDNTAAEKSASSSKLLGRGSSTLLEKIKADFNVSSKSAPDRVVQIRLQVDEPATDATPPKTGSTTQDYQESAQERDIAWQDVTNKLKTLILSSFALRVSQYEDDIRERESQRNLPGWNFCTFFMLKEGLARGFESVGLIDDALVSYDELSLGLESAMGEGDQDGMTTRSDSFLKYTKEMKDILLQCLTSDSASDVVWESGTSIVSTSRKDYRNLIVNSNVSLFDFQCYLFARQMSILLRMGTSHNSENVQTSQGVIRKSTDLTPFSEICQRGTSFISTASGTLRGELLEAAGAQGIEAPKLLLDNIVASFAYAVAQQVLQATDIPSLSQTQEEPYSGSYHQTMDRLQHPVRRSSLQPRPTSAHAASTNPVAMLEYLKDKLSNQQVDDELKVIAVSDLAVLAGNRADLLFLQRQIAERIARKKGWAAGITNLVANTTVQEPSETDVDPEEAEGQPEYRQSESTSPDKTRGILVPALLDALVSSETFLAWYGEITYTTLEQCVLAQRLKTVQRLIADLAVVKYDSGDASTSATYLSHIIPSFAGQAWDRIDNELARLHSRCLKKLNKRDDYVRMALRILAEQALHTKSSLQLHLKPRASSDVAMVSDGMLKDIITVSQGLSCNVIFPLTNFFVDINVHPYICHAHDQDGFTLELKIRYLLEDRLPADVVRMKLKCRDPPFHEFWLESTSAVTFAQGINEIRLAAQITCFGFFTIEKIVIKSKKLSFEAESNKSTGFGLSTPSSNLNSEDASVVARLPHILCYQTNECLAIEVEASHDISIDKVRMLEIILHTGRNNIQGGQLNIKAGSAGLRLMVANATIAGSEGTIAKGKAPGTLELAHFAAHTTTTIRLPYDLESNLPQITVGLEFTYTTPDGSFKYFSNPMVSVDLALDVSVHDLFKANLLYSRFQIKASRNIPLLIRSVDLEESDRYAVEKPPCDVTPLLILPRQEGTMLYKIKSKESGGSKRQSTKSETSLQLCVTYLPLNEVVVQVAEESLLQTLSKSHFTSLKQLLRRTLTYPLHNLSIEKLEEIAMLNELRLPGYGEMGWSEVLGGLEPELRQEVETWLRKWHEENILLPLGLPVPAELQQQSRVIRIRVPLPRLHILHTAKMSLSAGAFVSQGGVIHATIVITHTRRWDSPSSIISTAGAADNPIEFFLEVDAPPDTWLIGGQRRSRFIALEGEEKRFDLMLIPLKSGRLLLPEVAVRAGGSATDELKCETDYRSLGDTLLVMADIKSTTIGLNEVTNGTEAILIGSERRVY